ncbi:MAG: polysaccharide deacetylase family protein [Verrucomicrobiota bacterium]
MMNCLKSLSGRACLRALGFREASLPGLQELVRAAHDKDSSFVTIAEVLHGELPPDRVCLLVTFDGAQKSFVSSIQWLVDHGVPCLIHVSSSQIGQGESMRAEDITTLAKNPIVSFGNFTHSQRALTDLSDEEISREITQCQQALTEWTGATPVTLAYPKGQHDERVRRIATGLGIKAAFTEQRVDIAVPLKLKDGAQMEIGRWMDPLKA